MTAIINTKLILEDGIIWNGVLTYENGRIVELGDAEEVQIPAGAEIIDAHGLYTAPGLINVHVHGCQRKHLWEYPTECAEYLLAHGETTILATIGTSFTKEQMLEGGCRIREAKKSGAGRIIYGIYMEGPYMSGVTGNQTLAKWPVENGIRAEDYVPLVQGNKDLLRMWAVDPNREGLEEFLVYAKSEIPNLIFAYGHSRAPFDRCKKFKRYGFKVRTHIADGGQAPGRAQGVPGAGGDQFAIYDPDMYAEMIVDQNGIHVTPDLVKYFIKTNGVERTILISDSVGYEICYPNNLEAGIHYGPDLNYDIRGYLCGSRLTLNSAVRNVMHHTGYGLCHAIRMATLTPAQMLGIADQVGSLEAGKKANLILIDDMVNVKKVIFEGELSVENEA